MSLQSPAQIGRIIHNALIFDIKNRPGEAVDIDSLLQSVDRLFAILSERKINYVTLLQAYQPAVEPLLEEISGFIDQADITSLRDILAEIEQRIARFRKASGGLNEK